MSEKPYSHLLPTELLELGHISDRLHQLNQGLIVPADWSDCVVERNEDASTVQLWGPDGDLLAVVYDNPGRGIDAMKLAQLWAKSPDYIQWLLENFETASRMVALITNLNNSMFRAFNILVILMAAMIIILLLT